MNKLQSIRGMRDVLPDETPMWQWLESKFRHIAYRYGYQEMRLPLLEPVSLFERAVGETTDIVSKEMYNFLDKNGEHITLRPEGTSGCMRAVLENNMCYNKTQRLWYQGPMFRYERPQKGRLRQFTQFGVEAFGMAGADVDAELIFMVRDLFRELGILNHVRLEINSLGTLEERREHRRELVKWFEQHRELLDADSLTRLEVNPLRILDSKNPEMQEMIDQAPRLLDYLHEASRDHFETLCLMLDKAGIAYKINPRLVRGLDYYTRSVFEWITDALGSQGTVCGGGRYDGLAQLFSDKPLPASGFAIGIERLLLLIQTVTHDHHPDWHFRPDAVITSELDDDGVQTLMLAESLRQQHSALNILVDCSGAKLKKQHQTALKTHCKYIITLNKDDEIRLWNLSDNTQTAVDEKQLAAQLSKHT
ncbi:histidine--tRNA ligase [Izhakiella australiensis]|uniref:Histidine--tRNA ligase n=1 Tax=Izhakiella australiensis TaxID=1926881 RepID=A0A1S8YKF3_9GAMM|nr:histidine--tRNA ligase [Izhakiella australiensis]OON39337.1 histidine--tRNA ligase [Izhakiella australiensis]